MIDTIDETTYEAYLAALLAGKRSECAEIVQQLLSAGTSLKALYTDLFQRSLYQVGELWEKQRISVAVEHLCTAITERMLTLVQAQMFSGPARDQSIVIACVADEYHQLGARMVADFCEIHGWRGYFLGANTPLERLQRLIDERQPNLLGLSLAIYFNLPALLKALDAVSKNYPDLPILVGGQAFRWGAESAVKAYPKVSYMASLNQLEQRMAACEP
ncbi:MAG: cobalamin-binding protein [Betaproteobacteria bacterium HGW-Betaproteobacteria-7]|nr:MAG: cobalamin-binding protein [Betaproteobacteria bacterium HGW-Betaproteobacteria-7]